VARERDLPTKAIVKTEAAMIRIMVTFLWFLSLAGLVLLSSGVCYVGVGRCLERQNNEENAAK
jgi:hypothetical protein